jgi:hypothetical protein
LSRRPARPLLSDVTLVAVTSVALRATVDALRASMRQAEFGKVLLLSDSPPQETDPAITWRRIERLASRADYSRFMLRDLVTHIETSHALCVQWDGFVIKGSAWNPRFLDYDYIGAVWLHFQDGLNVGNGGFSLRSRRLLQSCRTLNFEGAQSEDVVIGRTCRPTLEAQGIRFAPEALARTFAYERAAPTGREFGFHGAFNLVRLIDDHASVELFESIERHMLARSERAEIMRWALAHRRFRLALQMLFRLL